MTVVVLTAVPPGLRGQLTRWPMEVVPGVFVGRISRRVRDRVWAHVVAKVDEGQGVIIFPAHNEQGFRVRTCGHDRWRPVDMDGLTLMVRPGSDLLRDAHLHVAPVRESSSDQKLSDPPRITGSEP